MRSDTARPNVLSDRYALKDRIGRGGMGEVYAADDQRLEREVAVKLLRADLAEEPAMCRRFENEARATARLTHPNVVGIFDTGVQDGVPYLVMERLPGTTLGDRMRAGTLNEEEARLLAFDVLAALAAAHDAGIVHRDVKPGNVLFASDGRAKVTDFGIAKIAEGLDQTATAMLLGTPVYMAPERFHGAPATPRSDLYSLGVVLYEALSGRKPFTGDNAMAIAHSVDRSDYPPLASLRPDLSAQLIGVVDRALAREPERRFDSADAMAAALSRSDVGEATTEVGLTATQAIPQRPAPPPPTTRKTPPPTARPKRAGGSRLGIAVAALAAVAVLAVGAWATQRDDGSEPAPEPTEAPEAPALPDSLPPELRQVLELLEDVVQP
jgi:serine/threonine protein kinase